MNEGSLKTPSNIPQKTKILNLTVKLRMSQKQAEFEYRLYHFFKNLEKDAQKAASEKNDIASAMLLAMVNEILTLWENSWDEMVDNITINITNLGIMGIGYQWIILRKKNGDEFLLDYKKDPFFLDGRSSIQHVIDSRNETRIIKRYTPSLTYLTEWINKDPSNIEQMQLYIKDLSDKKHYVSRINKNQKKFMNILQRLFNRKESYNFVYYLDSI